MAFYVGSFLVPATAVDVVVTLPGFRPTVGHFWGNGYTADGDESGAASRPIASPWWGLAVSTSARVAMTEGDDGVTANNTATDATKCIKRISGSTTLFAADFVSWDMNGFTVHFSIGNVTAFVVNYAVCDPTNVALITLTTPTSGGNVDYATFGFDPDLVWLLGADNASSNNSTTMGMGRSSTERWSWSQAANATTGGRIAKTSTIYTNLDGGNSVRHEADVVAMITGGIRLNWSVVNAATHTVYALGLKGASFKVGSLAQKTSGGTQTTSPTTFTPTGQIVFSVGQTAGAGIGSIQDIMSGAADGTHRAATQYSAGAQSVSLLDRTHVYRHAADDGTPTVQGSADLSSFNGTGWDWSYDVADATAREILFLAVGNAVAGGATPPVARAILVGTQAMKRASYY